MSTLENEIIKLKGTGDGVKVYLDAQSSISDITSMLYEKLRQYRKFFGDGRCNIYFAGRELSPSDKMRLEAIVKAMLPEGEVNYGDGKRVKHEKNIEKTLELPMDIEEHITEESEDESFKQIKEVVTSNFKANRARFYEGIVRNGRTIESDGHLVLVGDVEKGARLVATGNIMVFGGLYGSAHAGSRGSDEAYVVALDCAPEDIKISTERVRFEKSEFRGGSKKAYLIDGRIVGEDFPPAHNNDDFTQ